MLFRFSRLFVIVSLLGAILSALGPRAQAAGAAEGAGEGATDAIAISSIEEQASLIGRAEFLTEPGGEASLEAVRRSTDWQPVTEAERKRGLTAAKVWMRFVVENDSALPQEIVLTHDITRLTTFSALAVSPGGRVERSDYDPLIPYADRVLAYAGPAAALVVPAGERREVLVRFGNDHPIPIHLNLRLWSERGFERHSVSNTAFFAFWIGCLVTAASFWLLYGIFMRQARMVVYAVYMGAVAITYAIFSGVGLQFLSPDTDWFQRLGFNWSVFLLTAAAFEFARRHLDIRRLRPRHNMVLRAAVAAYAVATVLAFPSRYPEAETALTYFSLLTTPAYITWLSWTAWRRHGLSYASWMVVGWGLVSVTSLLIVGVSAVFVPGQAVSHIVLVRVTFVSMVIESLLLSASLAQWLRGQEVRRIAAEHAASYDVLTGLLNRRGFEERITAMRAHGVWPGQFWLVLIDLDRFKQINDTHSHAAGDTVLAHFASLLRRESRANDVTARFGGEEFILMFEAASLSAARSVAERVRHRFAETPTRYDGQTISHTLSAGLVRVAGDPADDDATLIAMADQALYAAKRDGRNCVRAYSDVAAGDAAPGTALGTVVDLKPMAETASGRS